MYLVASSLERTRSMVNLKRPAIINYTSGRPRTHCCLFTCMVDLCSQHSPRWIETGFLELTVEFEDYSQVAACNVASYPDTLSWVLQIYLYASDSYTQSREEYNVWIICSP